MMLKHVEFSGDPADGHTFLAYTNLPDYHRRDTYSLCRC